MNMKKQSSKVVQAADRKKKKKCRDYLDPDNFIISSKSRLKTVFDMICLLVVTYSIFYSLLFVSFDPVLTPEIVKINLFVTIVFGCDFICSKLFFIFWLINLIFIYLDFF